MKKSQRLQNISKVAEHHEQKVGKQLAQSRHHAEQQQQLQQLSIQWQQLAQSA